MMTAHDKITFLKTLEKKFPGDRVRKIRFLEDLRDDFSESLASIDESCAELRESNDQIWIEEEIERIDHDIEKYTKLYYQADELIKTLNHQP